MKVLLVKLTSLGDVIHTLAAAQEALAACPELQLHWAVDAQFASVLQAFPGLAQVHALPMRRRGLRWWHPDWQSALSNLRATAFDAIIDAQGLTKSAVVSRLARLAPTGRRYALGLQTDGSSYEAPTRWVADVCIDTPVHIHAVDRSRVLLAQALGYDLPERVNTLERPWLQVQPLVGLPPRTVALVHGTSRADKAWPHDHWLDLGERLSQQGFALALLHGNDAEAQQAQALRDQAGSRWGSCEIWPRSDLTTLSARLAACAGVVGVDGGVSHVAVALGRPHVQIYNFDTAWRTGPMGQAHQLSVFANPTPSVDAVWQAWQTAWAAQRATAPSTS